MRPGVRPGGQLGTLGGELGRLTGSPAALVDAADAAARAAERLADVHAQLLRVRATLDGQRSTAVERAYGRVTAVADDARASGGMLEAAAGTLRRHAVTLGDAQHAAERALADRAEARGREAWWRSEADDARRSTWNIAGAGFLPAAPVAAVPGAAAPLGGPEQAHQRLVVAEREVATASEDVAAAKAGWRSARDAKVEASRQAAAALAALADVRAVRAVTAAVADPAGIVASGDAARRVVALLPRAASGGDDTSRRALRDEVRRMLTDHADDPAFWAVFWDTTTPQGLYLALGPNYLDPTRPVSAELRTALGQGVATWAGTASERELREFGRGVVTGVGDWPLGLSERSWLAATLLPAELPAAAHAAAGDALDARWWARADEASAAAGTPGAPTGDALVDATITAPIAAAVLAGYARHPRLALDRLSPAQDTPVADSVRRWFGWAPRGGWPDGGRAVAGAFAAAVEEGTTSHDHTDQRRAALLVSHATPALASGLLTGPTLDDRASADVARAYEPYLPSVGESTYEQTHHRPHRDDPPEPVPAPGIDRDDSLAATTRRRADVAQPTLDAFALRGVVAATSRTPEAAGAWLGATDRHVATMAEIATSGAYDANTEPRYHLMEESFRQLGAVTGAMQSETLAAAYDEVETREATISLTGDALGIGTLGRSSAEALMATGAVQWLEFLDTSGPILEAQAEVDSVGHQTYTRYRSAMHDLFLAHDLGAGVPLDEAMRRAESLDSDPGRPLATQFWTTFDDMSEPSEETP